jgi:hypothetical protein
LRGLPKIGGLKLLKNHLLEQAMAQTSAQDRKLVSPEVKKFQYFRASALTNFRAGCCIAQYVYSPYLLYLHE